MCILSEQCIFWENYWTTDIPIITNWEKSGSGTGLYKMQALANFLFEYKAFYVNLKFTSLVTLATFNSCTKLLATLPGNSIYQIFFLEISAGEWCPKIDKRIFEAKEWWRFRITHWGISIWYKVRAKESDKVPVVALRRTVAADGWENNYKESSALYRWGQCI